MKEYNMKKINKIIIGTLVSFTAITAMAEGDLTQIGEPKNNIYHQKQLKGFANELPLITVMKQITPNGWIVKKSDTEDSKLDVKKQISWQGGKNWVSTLEEIAKNYDLSVVINWNKQVITLSNAIPKQEPKKGLFVLENSSENKKLTDVAVGASEQQPEEIKEAVKDVVTEEKPVAVAVAEPEVKPPPSWSLDVSKSLRDNVEIWAEQSGYRLVWTGEDYSVGQMQVFTGEFDAESGPIKQLSIDYGPDSRVQVPLSFQFYQNKTLVVENWLFEQAGFPQYDKKNK